MRVEIHPDARAELRSAAFWYEEQRPGLADELITEVNALLQRVTESPQLFPVWPGTGSTKTPIRRAGVERFPYLIAFEVHRDHILVLAFAHGRRRPLYWISRANEESG